VTCLFIPAATANKGLLSVPGILHGAFGGATVTVTKVSCLRQLWGSDIGHIISVFSQRLDSESKFCTLQGDDLRPVHLMIFWRRSANIHITHLIVATARVLCPQDLESKAIYLRAVEGARNGNLMLINSL
jgi:hypothetical protein